MTLDVAENSFTLGPDEIGQFHRQGYAGPFRLYEASEIKALCDRLRLDLWDRSHAVYKAEGAISGATNIANYDRHLDIEFLARHIMRSEIVDRVTSILGPDVICWRTEPFAKYPGDEGTDWHQADTFQNASGTPQILCPDHIDFRGTLTVWTAFTDTTTDTACLKFIPGTHSTMFYDESKGMHYVPESINKLVKDGRHSGFFGYDYRQLQIDPDWKPDESQAVSIEMNAGEFIIFWSTLMHASHPHRGKTRSWRLGYAARYVPTFVRVYPDTEIVSEYGGSISLEKYGAVLVAGNNNFSHNRMTQCTTRGFEFRPRRCAGYSASGGSSG